MPNKKKSKWEYIEVPEIWIWLAMIVSFFLIGLIAGRSDMINSSPECYATQDRCGIGYDILPSYNEDLLLRNVHLNECCKPPHYLLQGINLMPYWNVPGSRYYVAPTCNTTTVQVCENATLIDWHKDLAGCNNITNSSTRETCQYLIQIIGESTNDLIRGLCYRNITTCQGA
jgi:hypothetical protein